MPSRATITRLVAGATLGAPGDADQQVRVLEATLALLEQVAPVEPVVLDERAPVEPQDQIRQEHNA